jgi:hypothetical protein
MTHPADSHVADLLSALDQFTGSAERYQHAMLSDLTYTQGVRYMAEHACAYWLIDVIASYQTVPAIRREPFQQWKLVRKTAAHGDDCAVVTCTNGDGKVLARQRIAYTDFPLPSIVMYCEQGVILLPNEH